MAASDQNLILDFRQDQKEALISIIMRVAKWAYVQRIKGREWEIVEREARRKIEALIVKS